MERDFAAYLFTLFCPLFTSGASFSIAHEYSLRNLNAITMQHLVVFLTQRVHCATYRRSQKYRRRLRRRPFAMRGVADPRNALLPHLLLHQIWSL